mmetsp:Transcript_25983/g.77989  ORF Transcript_25983/g.77989 Transcript_25983/m.77989 type:complete len:138 (-) Transcript_25983:39-452(-)
MLRKLALLLIAAAALCAVVRADDDGEDAKPRRRKRPAGGGGGGGGKRPAGGGKPVKPGGTGKRPPFSMMVGLLKAYKAEHGHVNVPTDHTATAPGRDKPVRLGRWLAAVRKAAAANKMKAENKGLLDAVDPNWAKSG